MNYFTVLNVAGRNSGRILIFVGVTVVPQSGVSDIWRSVVMDATTSIQVTVAAFGGKILAPNSGLKHTADVHMFLTDR
jgi:hypothetical protein